MVAIYRSTIVWIALKAAQFGPLILSLTQLKEMDSNEGRRVAAQVSKIKPFQSSSIFRFHAEQFAPSDCGS
jgi:hypothetical protein